MPKFVPSIAVRDYFDNEKSSKLKLVKRSNHGHYFTNQSLPTGRVYKRYTRCNKYSVTEYTLLGKKQLREALSISEKLKLPILITWAYTQPVANYWCNKLKIIISTPLKAIEA